jgi:hypothetical protein
MQAIGNVISKAIEYGYVAWTYVKGPFAYVVNFTRNHPKTTLVIFLASHVVRGWL